VFILANRQNSQDWKKWEKYVHRLFKNTKDNYLEVLYYDINYFVNHLKKIVKSNSDDIKSFRTDLLIALSNNNELNIKEALFDNFNPNTEQELQAIAKDIPAFGDDVNEEKFDVDGKYNLPEVVQKRDNMEVASVKDIKTMRFKALTLPSKYRQLLGKVPANFRMLLWGSPGHGKSSLALTIANDIGKFVKTLYVSAEESLQSATLSSRIKRFKANARNLMFNDSNNPDILDKIIMTQNPKFVVIDSVNVMIGKTEAIINLMLKYPEVGFIIIAQATKDRKKYAGLGSLAHAVDIVVNVRSGMAVAEKNRYAQLGSMPVKGIKI
jgi:DNA replication protein DnaC